MSSPDLGASEQENVQRVLREMGLPGPDQQAVLSVLETPNLSMGPKVAEFEKAFCVYTGAKNAIAVSSGTAGLHLCIRAAGVEADDYVITTPFSFVASTNVILFERAVPVFVDVEANTGNIDPEQVREAARDLVGGGAGAEKWLPRRGSKKNRPLKALLPVDVFGQPADLNAMSAVAQELSLKVIEDSCEALGSEYKDSKAGRFGDYGVYAFYPNKQITTGEGGVVVTDDDKAAEYMRALRNQGRAPGDTWLQHTYLGYNYRMDEMSAALGEAQMRRIEELLAKREQVAAWYGDRLAEIPEVEPYTVLPSTTRMSWFVYVVKFAAGVEREALARALDKRGIPVRPYFPPIHLQPYMVARFGYQPGDFPVTEDLGRRGLSLPFSSVMSEAMVEEVCQAIRAEIH